MCTVLSVSFTYDDFNWTFITWFVVMVKVMPDILFSHPSNWTSTRLQIYVNMSKQRLIQFSYQFFFRLGNFDSDPQIWYNHNIVQDITSTTKKIITNSLSTYIKWPTYAHLSVYERVGKFPSHFRFRTQRFGSPASFRNPFGATTFLLISPTLISTRESIKKIKRKKSCAGNKSLQKKRPSDKCSC